MLAGWLLDAVQVDDLENLMKIGDNLWELIYNTYNQYWPVFTRVTELFVLVPVLLNLKGNLEMNLASRLSTSV